MGQLVHLPRFAPFAVVREVTRELREEFRDGKAWTLEHGAWVARVERLVARVPPTTEDGDWKRSGDWFERAVSGFARLAKAADGDAGARQLLIEGLLRLAYARESHLEARAGIDVLERGAR